MIELDDDLVQLVSNVYLTQENVKGYKFHCAGRALAEKEKVNKCMACAKTLTDFITLDLKEAHKHSAENFVPIWISKD